MKATTIIWANVDDDLVGWATEFLYEQVPLDRMPQGGRWDTPSSYVHTHIEKSFHAKTRHEAGVGDHYREMDRSDGSMTLWLCLGRRVELPKSVQSAWASEQQLRLL